MATLTRHAVRQLTLQTLFGLSANLDAQPEAVIMQALAGDPELENVTEVPTEVLELVQKVQTYTDDADLMISKYLIEGWTLDRLNLIDLEIMRIAIYEANQGDVPTKVAVNEALNLAKEFTDDSSAKFINGILSKVLTFQINLSSIK